MMGVNPNLEAMWSGSSPLLVCFSRGGLELGSLGLERPRDRDEVLEPSVLPTLDPTVPSVMKPEVCTPRKSTSVWSEPSI
jgi:hypothetical protein